jgi:uncharacterized membrane protein YbhN (UPF0104 family)
MADRITGIIYGLIIICPLFGTMYYLVRLLCRERPGKRYGQFFESPFKNKSMGKLTVKVLIIVGLIISCYLIVFISLRFFFPETEIPYLWNAIGLVCFGLYFGIFVALYGLGITAGHAGKSPTGILKSAMRTNFKSDDPKID